MNISKRKNVTLSLICIFVAIIVLSGGFLFLLLSDSSYVVTKEKVSAELVDKVRLAQKQNSTIEVNKEDLNQIISMYIKDEKSSGNIKIKGVSGDIVKGNLKLFIPISYNNINILITTEGGMVYEDNNIKYIPTNFKVGKIAIPKNFIMNKIKSHLKQGMTINDGKLFIDKNMLPFSVKSLEIKNDKILIGIDKSLVVTEENLKSIESKINKEISSNKQANSKVQNSSTVNSSTSVEESNSNSSKNTKNTSQVDGALDRIRSELISTGGSISTASQRTVLWQMISAVSSMKGNPNANSYAYAGSVRAAYNKLSSKEKAELKSALFSSINGADVTIVSKMLSK